MLDVTIDKEKRAITLVGVVDSSTAQKLKEALATLTNNHKPMTINLAGVEQLTSAGLRELLGANNALGSNKKLITLQSAPKHILNVLNNSGCADYFVLTP